MPQRKVYREEDTEEVGIDVKPSFEEAKKERLEKVKEMLEKYKNSELSMGLIESSIATIVFVPLSCFNSFEKKTPDDIRNCFGLFQLITLKLNECLSYIPMKPDFCRLLGISMATFSKYKNQDNSEYEDAINIVEDYIGGFTMQSAMQGRIKEISAVFSTKTTLGWKDTPEQVVQNTFMVSDKSALEMLNEYKARIPTNKDSGKIGNNKNMD